MSSLGASLLALIFLVPVELNGLQWFPYSTLAIVIEANAYTDPNVDDHCCLTACLESATDCLEFDLRVWVVPFQQSAFLGSKSVCFFSRGPPIVCFTVQATSFFAAMLNIAHHYFQETR